MQVAEVAEVAASLLRSRSFVLFLGGINSQHRRDQIRSDQVGRPMKTEAPRKKRFYLDSSFVTAQRKS
jgi:hypothetical protein